MRRYFRRNLVCELLAIVEGLVDHHHVGVLALSHAIIGIPKVLVHRVSSRSVSRGSCACMFRSPIELLQVSDV